MKIDGHVKFQKIIIYNATNSKFLRVYGQQGVSQVEDSKIVDLYWERSEQAISETQNKYGHYCLSIARNILPTREDAQESVNDTYLAAWNAMPPNRPSVLSTFLGKLTRRISIDRWRILSADKRGGGNTALALEELAECIPGGSDPEAEVETKELASTIGSFLDTLSSTERQIFLMRYFDLTNIQNISSKFNMSPSKVKSMLFRIRNKLREHLEKEGY